MENGLAMQKHQFDLTAGDSIRLGEFKVTLLEIEGEDAVLEIEGPDGEVTLTPLAWTEEENKVEDELPVLV